jgi:hypothetical protein
MRMSMYLSVALLVAIMASGCKSSGRPTSISSPVPSASGCGPDCKH